MDPKAGQIIDPKLKEAYDRVMGASVPKPASPPPTPSATMPPPAMTIPPVQHAGPPSPAHDPLDPMAKHENQSSAQPAMPPPSMNPAHPQTATPAASTTPAAAASGQPAGQPPHASMTFSAANGYVAPHKEGKSGISTPLLFVAGAVFIVVYTLFCMKVIGMPIPFLPQ